MMRRPFQPSSRRSARVRAWRARVEHLETRCLLSGTTFDIASINPANGTVVSSLPNGQIVVTLSEPVAGLSDGQSPIQDSGTFNRYDVTLIPRGPSGVFSAPSGVDGGDLPVHINVVYHVNGNGTSEFVITPTGSLSTDVYAVHVDLAAFKDASGNTLIDGNDGYRTFLLQLPSAAPNQPLAVTEVTELNDSVTIDNNLVDMPDTIQIHFNKALYPVGAGNGSVQLIANPGPNFTVVPSVAAYSPTTDSIYLTPTVTLSRSTLYVIRVAGQDSGSTYVSDDQGFGHPGNPLPHTFYTSFEVTGPVMDPATFQVGAIMPTPSLTTPWKQPVGYVSVQFDYPLNPQSLGRYSAMVIPRSGGLNNNAFDAGDEPLNATVAYNPNTWQLIIVPSQPVVNDNYLVALGPMTATNGAALPNNAGQPAGVNGNAPYYAQFYVALDPPAASTAAVARPSVVWATIPDAAVTGTHHRSETTTFSGS